MPSERIKRLRFIKKNSPKRFEDALLSGKLVPTAAEMNDLYSLPKRRKK